MNVIIRKGSAVLQLLPGENKTLLIGWNAFLILDLRLDVVDGIARLDLKGNGLASDCGEKYQYMMWRMDWR